MAVQIYPLLARGVFATDGYFVIDEETRHGFLIDPGAQPQLFLRVMREHGWTIEAMLLTHGHFDHIGAVDALRTELGIPAYAHELSSRYLRDPYLNLSAQFGPGITVSGTCPFVDGDRFALTASPGVSLTVLHVPGHTDDSCVFFCEQIETAFVGDSVYEGGLGLTIFPTGNANVLRKSVAEKLFTLPPTTLLLSGHSQPITVAQLKSTAAHAG